MTDTPARNSTSLPPSRFVIVDKMENGALALTAARVASTCLPPHDSRMNPTRLFLASLALFLFVEALDSEVRRG